MSSILILVYFYIDKNERFQIIFLEIVCSVLENTSPRADYDECKLFNEGSKRKCILLALTYFLCKSVRS